jgi:hypothetical protein
MESPPEIKAEHYPAWIRWSLGIVALVTALIGVGVAYYQLDKARAEARKANLEVPAGPGDAAGAGGKKPSVVAPLEGNRVDWDVIKEPFRTHLRDNPARLGEARSYEIVPLSKTQLLVLATGSHTLGDGSPEALLEAEKVCKIQAMAAAAEYQETRVEVLEQLRNAKLIEELTTQARAAVKALPSVGRWHSHGGTILHVAYGRVVDLTRP